MEKYQENLAQAIKNLQIADHMAYVTYPIVNEKRLLLKIFDEIHRAIINCISAILNYEYLYKRIHLYTENNQNLQTFIDKCAKSYGLTNKQIKDIREIIELNRQHSQSAMEFVKRDRVIILSDSLGTRTIDIQKIKEYLLLAKEFLMLTNNRIKRL